MVGDQRQLSQCGTVNITCVPSGDTTAATCDELFQQAPAKSACDEPASEFLFAFTGGSCAQSFNAESTETFICRDFNGGPSSTQGTTHHIVVSSPRQVGNKYFMGDVDVGLVFAVTDPDGAEILPETMVLIYEDDSMKNLLQMMVFKTACNTGNDFLNIGDDFGAVTLTSFTTTAGVTHDHHASLTYEITLTNVDPDNNVTIASVQGMRDGVPESFGSALSGAEIGIGGELTIMEELTLDLTLASAEHSVALTVGFHDGANTCMAFQEYEVNWQQ